MQIILERFASSSALVSVSKIVQSAFLKFGILSLSHFSCKLIDENAAYLFLLSHNITVNDNAWVNGK